MEFLSEPTGLVAAIQLIVGLVLISFSADHFVEGAASVARIAKISPVIVGAAIVGFGTSAPELLVSGVAAYNGEIDLGVGNIVGSNVANLTLVLGSAALVAAIRVSKKVLSKEAALSLLGTLAFVAAAIGGFNRIEGVGLVMLLVASLYWMISSQLRESRSGAEIETNQDASGSLAKELVRTVVGLIGVVLAAQALVWGATAVAGILGLSEGFVGVSLVAVGTSLPELVTVVVAARKGATDLIVGNLLGSNMFNSLAVGGAIALVGSGQLEDPDTANTGIMIMTGISIGVTLWMIWQKKFNKASGIGLLIIWMITMAVLGTSAS